VIEVNLWHLPEHVASSPGIADMTSSQAK